MAFELIFTWDHAAVTKYFLATTADAASSYLLLNYFSKIHKTSKLKDIPFLRFFTSKVGLLNMKTYENHFINNQYFYKWNLKVTILSFLFTFILLTLAIRGSA